MQTEISNDPQFDRCIYLLTDDKVISWTVALINSIRKFNGDLPIILLPHEDEIFETKKLCSEYEAVHVLKRDYSNLDEIGKRMLHGRGKARHRRYRKLATFNGPAQNFLFIDTDCLVLNDLSDVFDLTQELDIAFYNHAAEGRNFVSEPLANLAPTLTGDPGSQHGYNSAFFVSTKGVFPESLFERISHHSDRVSKTLGTATDQALISYATVALGAKAGLVSKSLPDWPKNFSVSDDIVERNGVYVRSQDGSGQTIRAIHWGGLKKKEDVPGEDLLKFFYGKDDFDIGNFT